jgi:hypothetical protein
MEVISCLEISAYDILEWSQLDLKQLKQINDSFIFIGLKVRAFSSRLQKATYHAVKSFFCPSFHKDDELENRWRDFYEI